MPDNIFLCGPSCVGKSTVAPLLAELRGAEAIDTDALVEAKARQSVATIFAREGEAGFRKREARAVAQACDADGAVVALGAGALDDPQNLAAIERAGLLVFLDASDETLHTRLGTATEARPMLSEPGALERLRAQRLPLYRRASIELTVDGMSPAEVAATLDELLLGAGAWDSPSVDAAH